MKKLDMSKIVKAFGAERHGKVCAKGGYFGAMALLADVQARFRVPQNGRSGAPELLRPPDRKLGER